MTAAEGRPVPPVGGPGGLRFGYGTNGFANHRLDDALAVIADLGYVGVALTLDHDHLDPFAPELARRVDAVARRLTDLGLAVVIETGARYLLDPWRKHAPTLLHDDAALRVEFLRRAVTIGADLGAEAVSFWAGVRPEAVAPTLAWDRLVAGCATVVEAADRAGVTLGFEPEPGMLVEDIAGWRRLHAALGAPACLGITLDIGHCRCLESLSVPDCVRDVGNHLVNVQIDDMRRGTHEHLEFGEGEIDFPPVLAALREVDYRGLVAVELPRHSHAAPAVAARSLDYLRIASTALPALATPVAGTAERAAAADDIPTEPLCSASPDASLASDIRTATAAWVEAEQRGRGDDPGLR
ncbi:MULTISPECIES: sugar phosphate isomerase/epimerase family protein [Micromonospora]|uniref:sugar phosphate isomerase/epimerase family protein n=1 Tax=Micromonospora TaxID=1873 RepID=UPI0002DF3280|nr:MULTISPECIES: sugar phosphate isomerase/epimerase family protein [Micromonospora]RUL90779.1 sugar phosphate isomerase/epimerase [Verrucosispora sp. FIM060022]